MITTARTRPIVALALVVAVSCGGGPGPGGKAVVARADDPISAKFVIHTASGPVRSTPFLGLATTPAAWQHGLMGRSDLPSDGGMVFVFPEPTTAPFSMKDTPISLSLAVWNEDARIADILDMEPCRADPCSQYRPRGPYLGAIEMRQGFFERNGVKVGDRIEVELLTY
jgi:uncharacterized membrane protein (UPF0127 family)